VYWSKFGRKNLLYQYVRMNICFLSQSGMLFEIVKGYSASVVLAFSQIWQGQPFFISSWLMYNCHPTKCPASLSVGADICRIVILDSFIDTRDDQ
jgi:hypothetical protein